MALDYLTVEAARDLPGLRLVLTRGLPAPWGLAARAIFDLKKIPFTAVMQEPAGANEALVAWTGHNSAPVAMFDQERPRAIWSEQLMLAERLAPEPRLIPTDEGLRAEMFGLCHELAAEDGLGWNLRTLIFARQAAAGSPMPDMVHKYGSATSEAHAVTRVRQILAMIAARIAAQAARGSRYLVGDALSAADIYWIAFSNLMAPMPDELCFVPDFYRAFGAICVDAIDMPIDGLIAQRDDIARAHLDIPVRF